MRVILSGLALMGLVACEPQIPDSAAGVPDPGRGVGFGDYDAYQQQRAARDAQLEGRTTVQPPAAVQGSTLDAAGQQVDPARTAALNSGVTPLEASPGNPAPRVVNNAAGISGENDFDSVAGQRDIEADARLIAQNRAQYQLVTPTDLPQRPGNTGPNIVAYALQTTNPVGTPLYRRSGLNQENKFRRACAQYTSSDLAQEDFLARGGPERDRLGMDPDGDGFACSWDPTPFRKVRGG
ncbi:hypothetical protein [Cognatishimia sp. F0-27]|uniref:hypothetical protein n=1 Tax=Cognatishimia sp. F0-27 TaxID=2816855 RepID=UPI001D0C6FB7|nr:hypothetical protein [Cognatishimia sp. F0-27]MCC1491572.1 hypothetical protein [Cognatishimia sp. F0-27]